MAQLDDARSAVGTAPQLIRHVALELKERRHAACSIAFTTASSPLPAEIVNTVNTGSIVLSIVSGCAKTCTDVNVNVNNLLAIYI